MSATSRVDDLRKRYHENPRRFFAPLANEYRKTGFTDRAILLCEKHLGEQPDNMNGLIVYGQCLFETGRLVEARAPFEAALAVDPENLIALRHLGDIARLGADHESARGWYQRVLEFDRRNDEVIALLAEVGGGAQEAPAPSIAPNIISVNSSVRVGSAIDSIGLVDLPEPTARPSVAPPIPILGAAAPAAATAVVDSTAKTVEISSPAKPEKRGSLFDLNFDFGEVGVEGQAAPKATPRSVPLSDMPRVEGLQVAELGTDIAPLAELESHEFAGGDADPLDDLESLDFTTLNPDVRAPVTSIAMDHMSTAEIVNRRASNLPMLSAFGEPEPPATRASATAGLPLLSSLEEVETVKIDVEDLRRRFETPATFVTETMAALYVQQGLHDKAVDVYRQLIVQSPDDQGLKDRLYALEHPAEVATEQREPPSEPPSEPVIGALDEFPEFEPEPIEAPVSAPPRRATAPRVTLDFDTPVDSDLAIEPPAPANAMLSEISFADVSLTTPHDPARRSLTPPALTAVGPDSAFELRPELGPVAEVAAADVAPHEPAVAAGGPSAREFFGAFARRALTPLSLMVVSAVPSAGGPLSPLDEIFGLNVDPNDESSAHRLAAVGATSGPSGGSALDSVFGEGPSAPMPAEALSTTPPRGSVPRASTKLRFDQFFASSVPSVTPSSVTPSSEAPVSAAAPEHERAPDTTDAAEDQAPGDDDLDQFQGWLRRLTQ